MSRPIGDPRELERLARLAQDHRVAIEREIGRRSFYDFFKLAWHQIDPAFLLDNWHIKLLCEELEAAARRENREVVINIPPRSLKSQIVGVAFPAWVFTWHASAKFITGSNEMRLATRDSVACRRLVQSKWYQDRWGEPGIAAETAYRAAQGLPPPEYAAVGVRPEQEEKTYWETTAGGHRFTATPGSNVTGHGADYILVDDPHPAQKAESDLERQSVLTWWFEAIPSRLNEPDRGVKIVIMQRLHAQDLAGECIKRGYHAVVLPAEFDPTHPQRHPKDVRTEPGELLHPERVSRETLGRLKRALGSYAAAGQLQQRPAPREGGMFKRHWFGVVDAVPAEARRSVRRGWDLAATEEKPGKDPDWTAGVRISRDNLGRFFIEDSRRFRAGPAEVDMAIRATAQQDGLTVAIGIPQDPGQAGKSQARALVAFLAGFSVTARPQTGSKTDRARPLASQAQAGNVFLVRGPWNEEFLDELASFPNGDHDDQVDAAVTAFQELTDGETGLLDYMAALAGEAPEQLPDGYTIVEKNFMSQPS